MTCTDVHEPTGAYGDSVACAGFQARAYSHRDAVTDGHASPGPGPNRRNADTHTQAYGDSYPCTRTYSNPNGNAGTDTRAHGDEQPYARANGDRNGNSCADASPGVQPCGGESL